MNRLSLAAGGPIAALFLTGCMDSGISACHDKLEVGITSPAPNALVAQGYDLMVEANVRSTCGYDLAESGLFSLTSTEEESSPWTQISV